MSPHSKPPLGALALVLATAGCAPTFAPPPRTAHDGAPGRLAPLESGVGGTYTAAGEHAGEARLRLPATDRLWLETGGTFGESFALVSLGARLNAYDSGAMPARVVLDVDLGLAGGAGGALCGNKQSGDDSGCDGGRATPDGSGWLDRFAYGAYAGTGLGVHVTRGFAPYARLRVQASHATNVPTTLWLSGVLGIDLRYRVVSWYGAIGAVGFANDLDSEAGLMLETGLTFHIGT